jgi:hypothetical protein
MIQKEPIILIYFQKFFFLWIGRPLLDALLHAGCQMLEAVAPLEWPGFAEPVVCSVVPGERVRTLPVSHKDSQETAGVLATTF